MKSVDDWVENQWGEAAMTDASGMVPSIKSDRAGGPWVELWGDWLHRVDIREHALAFSLGDVVAYIMFTILNWEGNFFCPT